MAPGSNVPGLFFEPVKPITVSAVGSFILSGPNHQGPSMLLLTAILRVCQPREIEPNDLLAQTRLKVGHVSLTVIALVYVLVTFWQTA